MGKNTKYGMVFRPVVLTPWWRRTGNNRTSECHWNHYQTILLSNLGASVQAVYRGHRLFDSDHIREGVTRSVQWFKSNRNILESDLIHTSSRRPS